MRRAKHYEANKAAEREKMKAAYAARMEANPDYNRLTYRAHRPKRLVDARIWAKENPDRRRAHHAKRRAGKRASIPAWYGELDDLVMTEAAHLCQLRQDVTGFAWHVDHMVPLLARTACGLHCAANLQVIPAAMNMAKSNKLRLTEPGEWLRHA